MKDEGTKAIAQLLVEDGSCVYPHKSCSIIAVPAVDFRSQLTRRQLLLLLAGGAVQPFLRQNAWVQRSDKNRGSRPAQDIPGAPIGLMCDLLAFPEHARLTTAYPRFAWIIQDSAPDAMQRAYQIQAASTPELLAQNRPDLWDSGKIVSEQSTGVRYAGPALTDNHTYCWRVRGWTQHNQPGPYSAPQTFRVGAISSPPTPARYPIAQSRIAPQRIVDRGNGRYFVDFGKAAFGRVSLSAPAGTLLQTTRSARMVQVLLGEAKLSEDAVNPKPGGSIRFLQADIALSPDAPLTVPEKVMPFRYCELRNYPGALRPQNIVQIADHYPFDDTASHFHCSDSTLNDVWELCKYSIKATTFLGVYIDGDRERKPYEADAYINQLGHYCVDREFSLARYTHEYLLANPTWPTEWQMHSIFIAWADYLYTGDDGSLRSHYAELKTKTLSILAREDGLISTRVGLVTPEVLASLHLSRLEDIVDWPVGERDGYKLGRINTVVNAFHYQSLKRMAQIAHAVGNTEDEKAYTAQAIRVYRAFNARLYNEKQKLYRDGEEEAHSSLHANMFALAFELVPTERQANVVAFVKSRGMACSVYGAQYLLEALYNVGEADYALSLLTAKTGRSWGHMLYEVGTTITLEAWDNRYKSNQDWNHAWGAAPANIIPRRLMGIEPLEPGFRKVCIKPQPGSLTASEITLPTVRGAIEASFQQQTGKSFHLSVNLPANMSATIYLPQSGIASPHVWMNGRERKAPTENGFFCIQGVGAGKHEFTMSTYGS